MPKKLQQSFVIYLLFNSYVITHPGNILRHSLLIWFG